MNIDNHMNAIRRFGAMIGDAADLSEAEQAQALADQREFREYIPCRMKELDRAALLLRFMHEVCAIPFWQARICVVTIIQKQGAFHFGERTVTDVATQLARETGNILIADATANIFIAAAEGTDCEMMWREVLEVLRNGQIVSDDEAHETSDGNTLH